MQWRARYGSMSEPAGPPPAVERDLDEPFAGLLAPAHRPAHEDS